MNDLYGDGAVDILKYMQVDEADVIRALLHEVKSLKEQNKAVVEHLINQMKASEVSIDKLKESHKEHLEYMDEIARDNGIQVRCRGCGEKYEIPVELSEMNEEGNYCNSGHGGAYHCAP